MIIGANIGLQFFSFMLAVEIDARQRKIVRTNVFKRRSMLHLKFSRLKRKDMD